jgi:hypothetical protein
VLEEHAVSFVPGEQPFFLYFAPIAPHPPSLPAPQDAGADVDTSWEAPPSFAEDDVSDKPGGGARPIDLEDVRGIREDMLRSLLAVDRAVEAIGDAVEEAGLSTTGTSGASIDCSARSGRTRSRSGYRLSSVLPAGTRPDRSTLSC